MAGTYASALLVLAVSAGLGQGLMALCGRREWSWLAPALGLAVACAVAWGAVHLSGGRAAGPIVLGVLLCAALAPVALARGSRSRSDRRPPASALAAGLPVILAALLFASLPFLVEGRFGILGTSLNPDMSQHLLAADRLVSGGEERLVAEGYPLGPHALAVSVSALGPSLVEAFGGLTLAVAAITALSALALLAPLGPGRRLLGALLVGLTYMAASYLVQGAFKETIQALFVLAFALALGELAAARLGGARPAARWRLLAGVPLAALAAGSVYAYSFPGLTWLAAGLVLWAAFELLAGRSLAPLRAALAPAAAALAVFALAIAPEVGRITAFAEFETFDPDGPGLGNLFNPISPLEALGIWPSGDFRLDPGAGAAPALAFWLGGALGLAALAYGLRFALRRGERALPAMLAGGLLLYLYAFVAGTPYQEAKAIVVAAPVAALIIVGSLLAAAPARPRGRAAATGLAVVYLSGAALSSLLALVNGPVGPREWTPDLAELRQGGALGAGGPDGDDTIVIAPERLLVDEHGEDLVLWELRGGRVCTARTGSPVPPGIEHVVSYEGGGRFALAADQPAGATGPAAECPFIADGARADPGG